MTHTSPRRMRYSALANTRGPAGGGTVVDDVLARARAAEDAGWDVVGFADMAIGDPFPALALMARETSRIQLMTRVVGVLQRSAPLIASAAAWVDLLSHERFTLGLGASSRRVVESRHGMPFDRPAARMRDAIRLIRALHGDPDTGARAGDGGLAFDGETLQVERAMLDVTPRRRVPIVIAASGPRMLEVAGAWCDGVIVELATPEFVAWAWQRLRDGAALVGRTLPADFDFIYQTQLAPLTPGPDGERRRQLQVDFLVGHMLQPEFDHMWRGGGCWDVALEVRQLVAAGDRSAADRLVEVRVHPRMAVVGSVPEMGERLVDLAGTLAAAGVTTMTLPLELEAVAGLGIADLMARTAEIPVGEAA